ncbi:MAG: ABC transporter ATP-binding protein [Thermoleophilia bacterium]|nr:ABC transporter ATP-binding protein [Thermoleophilia bacterium]
MPDAADNDEVLLAAHGVARSYGSVVALAPTTVSVRSGETLALVGPNGAGKSTLLALLAGALAPTGGEVQRTGEGVRVGWVPQRPAQYGRLSARENLLLFARLERLADPESVVDRVLALVDIVPPDRAAAELSVGNQQRLNLAIALLGDPDVLLLDEPTAALDPAQRRRLWQLASGVRNRGGAVVFATQNLDELDRFADAVGVLQDGRLVFQGPADAYAGAPAADVFA